MHRTSNFESARRRARACTMVALALMAAATLGFVFARAAPRGGESPPGAAHSPRGALHLKSAATHVSCRVRDPWESWA